MKKQNYCTSFTEMTFSFLLIALLFGSHQSNAQGYIRGGAGAGFNTTQDAFALPAVRRDSSNVVIHQRTIFGSFGQGARFSLAGGYMFTPYFGAELEIYYFQGFKQEYGSDISPLGDTYYRTGYSYQLRATPSLVVQAPEGKFQPFARFGVLIPFFGKTVLEEETYVASLQQSQYKKTNIDGKLSVGFESSVGLQYNINDNLGIYVQATYTGLRIRSDKGEVVQYDETDKDGNVTDNLETAFTITTKIEFQDELTEDSNFAQSLYSLGQIPEDIYVKLQGNISNVDFDKPINLPTQTSNFNSLSFSVGVKYTFGSK